MKSSNKKNSKKKTLIILVAIVLAATAGVATAYFVNKSNSTLNSNPTNSVDSNGKSDSSESTDSDAGVKEDFLDNESSNDKTNTAPTDFNSGKITIESTQDDSSITILARLTSFTGGGVCTLKLAKGSVSITESAEIIYQPEYSTCAGFSIDKKRLSSGLWSVSLSVTSEGKAHSQTSELTIR